ncbi:MAG: Type 1 glutamine amidotransferase-like domain-containing protein [Caldilineaceae bacterium]|nr:Type 1 glutamine amidotransferase-like domain-containing protein [Caldilineaceae bacterium]MCB0124189.1 Type 1 glutamine amidotransferase-like domain-containing protein [Caldilineaceae bacterium]
MSNDMVQGKIALGGGGGAADSRLLDETFASWIGAHGRLLYLPLAMRGLTEFSNCFAWIRETFAPLEITNITMWHELASHRSSELADFDAIYIGGGNTYSLLGEFLESRFGAALRAYVYTGGSVYGGSAGAVLLGRDLRTVAHMDTNSIDLQETACLNLAQDHAVWVHYTDTDDARIHQFSQTTTYPVIALAERTGVIIEAGTMATVGYEPAYQFTSLGKERIP